MGKILVTGGTGLIGSEVVRQLVEAGEYVVSLDYQPQRENLADVLDSDRLDVVGGDIADLGGLLGVMKTKSVDRVVHLGAAPLDPANPMKSVDVNVRGTGNVYDAARLLDVRRVCAVSSVAVYGNVDLYGKTVVTEDDPPAPTNIYGADKLMMERLAELYAGAFGLDVVVVRPPLAFGPGRLTGGTGLFNAVVRQVALGEPVVVRNFGTAESILQPIYVKDMARALVVATLADKVPSIVYNAPVVGSITLGAAMDTLRQLVPEAKIEIEDAGVKILGGVRDKPGQGWNPPQIDGSRLRRELGVVPEYSLRDAFAEMIALYGGEVAR